MWRHKVSKCFWKNGTNQLAQHRVATNLQSVKDSISAKHNKAKCNKTRYTFIIISGLCSFFFFNLFIIYLLFYFWLCWVFVSVRGLSLVVASGGHSSLRCAGLSPSRPLIVEHRLQTRRLSSCGSRAQSLRGMWDPPRPGLEPVSPALADRLPTTAPPGKPWSL